MAVSVAKLPIIDLSSPDRLSTAESIRKACIDYGFFYLANHGVEEELIRRVFEESRKFFSLPLDEKSKLPRKNHRGYTPLYAENLDPDSSSRGDSKESFYVGPLDSSKAELNQWPSEEVLPSWRFTLESYHKQVMSAGIRLISLIALALKLDENHFQKIGALDEPEIFLRLLHYPGELGCSDEELYGASAHSDYGMVTLLIDDGVAGLQACVCREKSKQPRVWEEVPHLDGCFVVNIGDMMERWTNCLFRSTLHRVMPTGQERYSMACFFDPNPDCIIECLESCCSESSPPRFPAIRSMDYLQERFRLTYGS
ncbi:2-oxoglutarate-Fe(II) type oxidoreductase hxnY [Linum grandiflorum]